MKQIFKTALLLIILGFSLQANASTVNVKWQSHNHLIIPDYKLELKRPNDRWKVQIVEDQNILALVYAKSRKNLKIEVSETLALPNQNFRYKKSWYTRRERETLKKTILRPFLEQGFQFYRFDLEKDFALAEATNAKREILLIKILFKKRYYREGYYSLSLRISRKDYLNFKDDFLYMAEHFQFFSK